MNTDWAKAINLIMKARGAATVFTVWVISMAAVGIFGNDKLGGAALMFLLFAGGIAAAALVKISDNENRKQDDAKSGKTNITAIHSPPESQNPK